MIEREDVYLHGLCARPEMEMRYSGGRRSIREPIYLSFQFWPFMLRERFDVIDCGNFPYFLCFPSKAASLLKGTPLVITWAEVWDNYWYQYLGKLGIFGRIIERITAKLPSAIVVETRHNRGYAGILGL